MSDSEKIKVNFSSRSAHRGLQKSTTLNRRYVQRPKKLIVTDKVEKKEPAVIKKTTRRSAEMERAIAELNAYSPKISHIHVGNTAKAKAKAAPKAVKETPDLPPAPNPYQAAIDARKAAKEERTIKEVSSKALKDAAIARAMAEAEKRTPSVTEKVMLNEMKANKKALKNEKKAKAKVKKETKHFKKHRSKRLFLALVASAACMLGLAALVKVNLPNISVKVAALQTGVEASYPSYIPRDFSITDVYTDNSTVVINFTGPNNTSFTLSEEKSSWSSSSLLTNYVKSAYGSNYEVIREQGITIYISSSNASWVNKGIFYRINASNGTLSKKQIKNIVTSL